MTTSPLLARRDIPLKERVQKAIAIVIVFAAIEACVWSLTGASLESDRNLLLAIGLVASIGIGLATFFLLKKHESAISKEDMLLLRARIDDDRQGRSWFSRIGFNTRRFLAGIIILAGALIVLAGLGILAVQIYGYLRFGKWESWSFLHFASPYLSWLGNPQSWLGLHKIVKNLMDIMPLSLALLLSGWFVAGFGSGIKQRLVR